MPPSGPATGLVKTIAGCFDHEPEAFLLVDAGALSLAMFLLVPFEGHHELARFDAGMIENGQQAIQVLDRVGEHPAHHVLDRLLEHYMGWKGMGSG
jgi:hypothetical protein